uniref:Uncharacterized protein n=1 Tax=Arundo donax TaxID=35708 RepID=A0A0A9A199_ARUDO
MFLHKSCFTKLEYPGKGASFFSDA